MIDIEGYGKIPFFATHVGMAKKGINADLGKEEKKKKQGKFKTRGRNGWYKNEDSFVKPIKRVKTHDINHEFKN